MTEEMVTTLPYGVRSRDVKDSLESCHGLVSLFSKKQFLEDAAEHTS